MNNKERYSRQSFLGKSSQEIFEKTIVGVVGLGGGGSHIIQQLAHIGFKRYELYDPDVVDESNLNRMVGAKVDSAAKKVSKLSVAEFMIRGLQPDAEINGHQSNWQDAAESLKRCHLVFGCLDSFIGRDQIEQFTRRYLIAYVDIGMDVVIGSDGRPVMGGQVIASLPGFACMRCMNFITDERLQREAEKYGDAGSRPQVIWANGVLASSAIGVGVDLLTDWTQQLRGPVYLEYDGSKGTIKNRSAEHTSKVCTHYDNEHIGEPVFEMISEG